MVRNQLIQNSTGQLFYESSNINYTTKFNITNNTDSKHFRITAKQYEGFNFSRIQLWLKYLFR